MKWKKMNSTVYLIFVTCLFTSCAQLNNSNFNRKKYLDLKIEKSTSDKDYSELDQTKSISPNSEPDGTHVNKTSSVDSETHLQIKVAMPEIQTSKSDLDSICATDGQLFFTSEQLQLNDTLFFESGKVKPCAIYAWEGGFVDYYLMNDGVATKRSVSKKMLSCYAVYDSINQLQYYEGDCWYPVANNPYIDEAENASKSKSQNPENENRTALIAGFLVLTFVAAFFAIIVFVKSFF